MTIRRILAANRGEIVSRVARSAHRRGIDVVAVYATSDRHAHYLADADVAVDLGDDASSSPYLDIEKLIAAALRTECDAVHPGFGFLAENAEFARAVEAAGLIWIGPGPEAIEAMGGKIEAKNIARAAGVPVLDSIELSDDVEKAAAAAEQALRLPLLVKPSAGGGGKGMHRVDSFSDLENVLRGAQREAQASFGDGTLFIERYVETARHVEVQLMADRHGSVIHLGTRDCSIQRRHQKIVEEAPAPRLPQSLLEHMCASSADLARSIGYVGAGTVEFLVFGDEYAFLEMNTRLQVEHPVTEEITGLDLVDLQISVAAGDELPVAQQDVALLGHAIEVRLYAEDPGAGFLPSPGTVTHFHTLPADGIRWETGVTSGSPVSSRYDPMIAKLVATGRDRDEARSRLVRALRHLSVSGVRTNREMLIAVLEEPDFIAADLATRFIQDHPDVVDASLPEDTIDVHLLSVVLAAVGERRARAKVQPFAPAGWRNVRSVEAAAPLAINGRDVTVFYRPLAGREDETWAARVHDRSYQVTVLGRSSHVLDLVIDGLRYKTAVTRAGEGYVVSGASGQSTVVEKSALAQEVAAVAGALVSPLPGIVVSVETEVGAAVEPGDCLLVVEAMKMEHRIIAAHAGVVSAVHVSTGSLVEHDQLLASIEESN